MAEERKETTANGITMNLEQVREYLQEYHGIPIMLRRPGTTSVKCRYCDCLHEYMEDDRVNELITPANLLH